MILDTPFWHPRSVLRKRKNGGSGVGMRPIPRAKWGSAKALLCQGLGFKGYPERDCRYRFWHPQWVFWRWSQGSEIKLWHRYLVQRVSTWNLASILSMCCSDYHIYRTHEVPTISNGNLHRQGINSFWFCGHFMKGDDGSCVRASGATMTSFLFFNLSCLVFDNMSIWILDVFVEIDCGIVVFASSIGHEDYANVDLKGFSAVSVYCTWEPSWGTKRQFRLRNPFA